jgi:undecaprenyl-diphosphatase
MSIPTLVAVSIFNLKNVLVEDNLSFYLSNLSCIIFSFIFSYFTIKFFFNFLKKYSFTYFVIYRILLGVLILFYAYFL